MPLTQSSDPARSGDAFERVALLRALASTHITELLWAVNDAILWKYKFLAFGASVTASILQAWLGYKEMLCEPWACLSLGGATASAAGVVVSLVCQYQHWYALRYGTLFSLDWVPGICFLPQRLPTPRERNRLMLMLAEATQDLPEEEVDDSMIANTVAQLWCYEFANVAVGYSCCWVSVTLREDEPPRLTMHCRELSTE